MPIRWQCQLPAVGRYEKRCGRAVIATYKLQPFCFVRLHSFEVVQDIPLCLPHGDYPSIFNRVFVVVETLKCEYVFMLQLTPDEELSGERLKSHDERWIAKQTTWKPSYRDHTDPSECVPSWSELFDRDQRAGVEP